MWNNELSILCQYKSNIIISNHLGIALTKLTFELEMRLKQTLKAGENVGTILWNFLLSLEFFREFPSVGVDCVLDGVFVELDGSSASMYHLDPLVFRFPVGGNVWHFSFWVLESWKFCACFCGPSIVFGWVIGFEETLLDLLFEYPKKEKAEQFSRKLKSKNNFSAKRLNFLAKKAGLNLNEFELIVCLLRILPLRFSTKSMPLLASARKKFYIFLSISKFDDAVEYHHRWNKKKNQRYFTTRKLNWFNFQSKKLLV